MNVRFLHAYGQSPEIRSWKSGALINFVITPLTTTKRLLPTLLAAVLHCGANAQVGTYSVGQTVDDFTVTDAHGNVHNLYSITAGGKHVMLDFFFVDCQPCQATQPYFNQLHEVYGCNGHDLFVLSINRGTDSNAQVDQYEATYGSSHAHGPAMAGQGGSAAVKTAFGISAYPTYCLIGPDNKLKNGDIWPVGSMQSLVHAFPAGSNILPAQCSLAGIDEIEQLTLDRLFPNPTTGTVAMDISLPRPGRVSLEVQDALGRLAYTQTPGRRGTGHFMHTLDLGALNNGHYTLRLLLDGIPSATRRLVVAH